MRTPVPRGSYGCTDVCPPTLIVQVRRVADGKARFGWIIRAEGSASYPIAIGETRFRSMEQARIAGVAALERLRAR